MTLKAILLLMQPEQEVINRWTGSAPYWEKHREIIRQMFAPVTQALVEDGQIGTGHVVLDIATGPGEPALTVWHFAENNPFHYSLSRVIDRYIESPPLAPDALDAFRFATPGKLRTILMEAGAMSLSERLL